MALGGGGLDFLWTTLPSVFYKVSSSVILVSGVSYTVDLCEGRSTVEASVTRRVWGYPSNRSKPLDFRLFDLEART